MIKASIGMQELRRKLYAKAKAEPHWRFWGLYVHVCKMETLRAAYAMAKGNDGAKVTPPDASPNPADGQDIAQKADALRESLAAWQ